MWQVNLIKFAPFVAIAVLLLLLIFTQKRLDKAEDTAADWEQRARTKQAVLEKTLETQKRLQAALNERDNKLRRLNMRLSLQQKDLKELQNDDKATADWGNTPVPDALGSLLKPPK